MRAGGGWLGRAVREFGVRAVYGHRGVPRVVNGLPLRALPKYRWYFTPEYDLSVARYFQDRVRPGGVCVSVGANLGLYPLQFAHWAAPGGRVYAFEPNPQTAAALRRHLALNRVADRVEVIERAVADAPGEAVFHMAGVDGMSRLGEPNPTLAGQTAPVRVAVDTLDRFAAGVGARVSALMMDIEGFEIAALRGAQAVFAGRPVAVVELHPDAWAVAGTGRADLERWLADTGLRIVPLSGQVDPLAEYGHVALEPRNP